MGIPFLIPKEARLNSAILEAIAQVDLAIETIRGQKLLVDRRNEIPNLQVMESRQGDIYSEMREEGTNQSMGFIGLDKLAETNLAVRNEIQDYGDVVFSRKVEVRTRLPAGGCRVCFCDALENNGSFSVEKFEGTLATSYINIARKVFDLYGRRDVKVRKFDGGVEEKARARGMPILEIVQTGGSLEKVNYGIVSELFRSSAVFVTSTGLSAEETEVAEKVSSRLSQINESQGRFTDREIAYLSEFVRFAPSAVSASVPQAALQANM